MGISGLLKQLQPLLNKVHVSKYSGQTVAIDGLCWLHKGYGTQLFANRCQVGAIFHYGAPSGVHDTGHIAAHLSYRQERRQISTSHMLCIG
jgi:hypothetical protein